MLPGGDCLEVAESLIQWLRHHLIALHQRPQLFDHIRFRIGHGVGNPPFYHSSDSRSQKLYQHLLVHAPVDTVHIYLFVKTPQQRGL
ncbi:hypothetical protein D3C75_1275070 [compost metagenome]